MKKIIFIIPVLIFVILTIINFIPKEDVFLGSFTISEDGKQVSMEVGTASSLGYIGRNTIKKSGNGLYVKFYFSFIGRNTVGGGNQVNLKIFDGCDSIYFYGYNNTYEMKLKKNIETNHWERAD